jgi:hypothetical protein
MTGIEDIFKDTFKKNSSAVSTEYKHPISFGKREKHSL